MKKTLVQNGDAYRIFEYSVQPRGWEDLLSFSWLAVIWFFLILVLVLYISVSSLNDRNIIARLASFMYGQPARDLFFKIKFKVKRPLPSEGNVSFLPEQQREGYLRYLDLSKATMLTEAPLEKGQVVTFNLNSLPGLADDEPVELTCQVQSCRREKKGKNFYVLNLKILRLSPTARMRLTDFLDSFGAARGGPRRA